jgi:hypothetical protein
MRPILAVTALLFALVVLPAQAQKVIRVWHTETQPKS